VARVVEGLHSFTCTPTRLSTNGMNRICLCIPSQSWSSFIDPRGMEGRVGLGTTTVSKRYVAAMTVVSCSSRHASGRNRSVELATSRTASRDANHRVTRAMAGFVCRRSQRDALLRCAAQRNPEIVPASAGEFCVSVTLNVGLQSDTHTHRQTAICYMAVCVSVALMCCAQTTESMIMRFSSDCSPAILVYQI